MKHFLVESDGKLHLNGKIATLELLTTSSLLQVVSIYANNSVSSRWRTNVAVIPWYSSTWMIEFCNSSRWLIFSALLQATGLATGALTAWLSRDFSNHILLLRCDIRRIEGHEVAITEKIVKKIQSYGSFVVKLHLARCYNFLWIAFLFVMILWGFLYEHS